MGYLLVSVVGYYNNAKVFYNDIEKISSIAGDSTRYQMDFILSEPINVSHMLTGSVSLNNFLSNVNISSDTSVIESYLTQCRDEYGYSAVYMISTKTLQYYQHDGVKKTFSEANPEDEWFFEFINSGEDFNMNIVNDDTSTKAMTIYVNWVMRDASGYINGVAGVALGTEDILNVLNVYSAEYDVNSYVTDSTGKILLSALRSNNPSITQPNNIFTLNEFQKHSERVFSSQEQKYSFWYAESMKTGYITSEYIPSLHLYLVTQNDASVLTKRLIAQMVKSTVVIVIITLVVALIVTAVVKKYHISLSKYLETQELEYHRILHTATEELYESIFEFNITLLRAGSNETRKYFENSGISGDTPYDDAIKFMAENQIKEEYIEGYLTTFSSNNVKNSFAEGINNLTYDFMLSNGDGTYRWMRIHARIFYWDSDKSIRMLSYRENIDHQRTRELQLLERSQTDALSGVYNKITSEDLMDKKLKNSPECMHALFIMDIDNFKYINDTYGHVFGDYIIQEFAKELKSQFRDTDVVGRIGGDEFAAMMSTTDLSVSTIAIKLDRFCSRIRSKEYGKDRCTISTSIGVALSPHHGTTYYELYEKADQALYYTKSHGKDSFTIYNKEMDSASFYVNQRDLNTLIDLTTDGISKVAFISNEFKILYFNNKRVELTGSTAKDISSPNFSSFDQVHKEDHEILVSTINNAIPTRTRFSMNIRMIHSSGEYIPVTIRGIFVNELYQGQYPIFYIIYIKR